MTSCNPHNQCEQRGNSDCESWNFVGSLTIGSELEIQATGYENHMLVSIARGGSLITYVGLGLEFSIYWRQLFLYAFNFQ